MSAPPDGKDTSPSLVGSSRSGPINFLAEVALRGGRSSALSGSSGERPLSNPRTTPVPSTTGGPQISALLDRPMSTLDRSPGPYDHQQHSLQQQQQNRSPPERHHEYSDSPGRSHGQRSNSGAYHGGSIERERYALPSISMQQASLPPTGLASTQLSVSPNTK
jgi:hypothetical protein